MFSTSSIRAKYIPYLQWHTQDFVLHHLTVHLSYELKKINVLDMRLLPNFSTKFSESAIFEAVHYGQFILWDPTKKDSERCMFIV